MSTNQPEIVVAVPVKNEAECIGECLRALALQNDTQKHHILLFLNNCTDPTARVVRAVMPSLPVQVHLVDVTLPHHQAHAGFARSAALARAAELVRPDGYLMTTDADGRVAPDWISSNLAHLRSGSDAVAGKADIDPLDATLIPQHLHDADHAERAYAAALDEASALIDPDAADPWPRHQEDSGASIAVTCRAFHRAGGMPATPVGEDRAFIDALRRVDARIRHAPEIRVVVSGRIIGRAKGGMADTIRRRMKQPDELLDDRLEPAGTAIGRVVARRAFRRLWVKDFADSRALQDFSKKLAIPLESLRDLVALPYFGSAWAEIETRSPVLVRRRVAVSCLAQEMTQIATVLSILRGPQAQNGLALTNRSDIAVADTAERA